MSTSESPNEFFTKLVWSNLWNSKSPYYLPNVVNNGIKQGGVDISPLGTISLPNIPPSGSLQLMKSDNLASWLPVKTGYVGIEFSNVVVQQLGSMTDGGLTYTDNPSDPTKGSIAAKINIPNLQISGKYVVVATGLAECALDTAGALSFLPVFDANAESAEATAVSTDDSSPTLDDYLTAATNQRTKLWQTPNGGQLMDKYYDHNEVYNWMFQQDPSVQYSWQLPENKQFMQQTYQASEKPSSALVNSGTYSDMERNEDTSYNKNAFNQQITITFSALGWANNPPPGASITSQQFTDAANAASSFGSKQVKSTGNTENETTAMTFDDVYNHVSSYQAQEAMNSAPEPQLTLETLVLTDSQRKHLQRVHEGVAARATMATSSDGNATLVQGTFALVISGGQLTLNANLTFPNSGNPTADVTAFSANFTVASITINNISDWTLGKLSSIGHQIDQALQQAAFIRNLLSDKTNDALGSDTVKNYISTWINDTFAKVLGPLTGE